MKNFLLMPDSFKGTMSSLTVCKIMEESIRKIYPESLVKSLPVADGGEGSVDAFLTALSGEKIYASCSGAYFEKITSFYGKLSDSRVVIEMASCAGLPLVEGKKDPKKTTTYGVGELALNAINNGVKEIVLALGGSCTNDLGAGFASALGVKFLDKDKKCFIPVGGTLSLVDDVDVSGVPDVVKKVKFTVMCDVDNPPYGKEGASYVFARQKGASDQDIIDLDEGVKHICSVIKNKLGIDLTNLPGGGAAGAMASGLVAFFGAELKMGIETVLDLVDFDQVVNKDTVIFTGEGKIDSQSVRGKVISGIAKRAKKHNLPVIVIVGGAEGDLSAIYDMGINSVFTINRLPEDFSVAKAKSETNLATTMENVLRLMRLD